jgi:hypothetical protein
MASRSEGSIGVRADDPRNVLSLDIDPPSNLATGCSSLSRTDSDCHRPSPLLHCQFDCQSHCPDDHQLIESLRMAENGRLSNALHTPSQVPNTTTPPAPGGPAVKNKRENQTRHREWGPQNFICQVPLKPRDPSIRQADFGGLPVLSPRTRLMVQQVSEEFSRYCRGTSMLNHMLKVGKARGHGSTKWVQNWVPSAISRELFRNLMDHEMGPESSSEHR